MSADLLLEIARCPIIEQCVAHDTTHPCGNIIRYQWADVPREQIAARWRREHHVPEPWVGHLQTAPLLFLSSNPNLASRRKPGPPPTPASPLSRLGSHSATDHPSLERGLSAPKWDWSDPQLRDRFESAFEVFMTPDGTAHFKADGDPDTPVPYWRAIKQLADHLFGRPTTPGRDYALTEVVHCKSPNEIGVKAAVKACGPRYLSATIKNSTARVICVVGRVARMEIRREYRYPNAEQVSSLLEIEGRRRLIVFVSGPNARDGRTAYPKSVPDDQVGAIREWLASR